MGSRVKELAEAEAATAEAEVDEAENGDGEDEAEAEDEQAEDEGGVEAKSPEQASMEAFARKLDAEMRRHEKALARIFEVEPPLEPAPIEDVIGFVVPGGRPFVPHEDFRPCSTCNGRGDVLTGSRKQGNETQPCPRCAGRGYLNKLTPAPPPATPGYEPGTPLGTGIAAPFPQTVQPQPAPALADNGDDGYGVPSWAGDPSIRPGA